MSDKNACFSTYTMKNCHVVERLQTKTTYSRRVVLRKSVLKTFCGAETACRDMHYAGQRRRTDGVLQGDMAS